MRAANLSLVAKFFASLLPVVAIPTTFAQEPTPVPGKLSACEFICPDGLPEGQPRKLRYWLYVPKDFSAKGDALPLLLFLHGAGERGDQLELVKTHGPLKEIENGRTLPCIVVAPQHPGTKEWPIDPWPVEAVDALVDHITARLPVEKSRRYVTGLSLGGYGTWSLLALSPEKYAAAVPICGGGNPKSAGKLTQVPIWAFHGAKDSVVPLREGELMVQAVQQAGGNAKLTVYPEAEHDSWSATYANDDVYRWLFEQHCE